MFILGLNHELEYSKLYSLLLGFFFRCLSPNGNRENRRKKRQGHFLALPAMFREQRLLLEPSPYDRETGKAGAEEQKGAWDRNRGRRAKEEVGELCTI